MTTEPDDIEQQTWGPEEDEPDPFEDLKDFTPATPDDPHVAVVVGRSGKKPYANVVGPFPNRTQAASYVARSRRVARARGDIQRWNLTFHVRPLMDPALLDDRSQY